jgi:hypothetical protein
MKIIKPEAGGFVKQECFKDQRIGKGNPFPCVHDLAVQLAQQQVGKVLPYHDYLELW